MKLMNPIYEFLDSGLLEIFLQILGIAVSIFLLVVLYRVWVVLGLVLRALKALRFYRRAIVETLVELRQFCTRFNQPDRDDE